VRTYKDVIFSLGDHEGFVSTPETLRNIVANFKTLRNNFRVPLKLGHDDEQTMTDGQPAIGWIDRLELDNDHSPTEVFAHYSDMPEIVYKAIKNKMYRARSIELENQFRKGKLYENVLVAVALLGSQLPRVEKLSDLGAYFSASKSPKTLTKYTISEANDASVERTGRLVFSVNTERSAIMTPEQILKLQSDLLAEQSKTSKLAADVTKLTGDITKFASDKKANDAAALAAKVLSSRKTITDMLEGAVKDERITPAKRDMFSKVLRIDDDTAVIAISVEDVEALVGEPKETFSKKGTASSTGTDDNEGDDVSLVLSRKVFSHMEKSGTSDFAAASAIVMQANPKLAAAYIVCNGEKE